MGPRSGSRKMRDSGSSSQASSALTSTLPDTLEDDVSASATPPPKKKLSQPPTPSESSWQDADPHRFSPAADFGSMKISEIDDKLHMTYKGTLEKDKEEVEDAKPLPPRQQKL
eukprot:13104153-Alexandrium_andersonii.AAC.1